MKKRLDEFKIKFVSLIIISLLIMSNVSATYYYKLDDERNIIRSDEHGKEEIYSPTKNKGVNIHNLFAYAGDVIIKEENGFLKIETKDVGPIEIPIDERLNVRWTPKEGLVISGNLPTGHDGHQTPIIIDGAKYYPHSHGTLSLINNKLTLKNIRRIDDNDLILTASVLHKQKVDYIKEKDGSFSIKIDKEIERINIAGFVFESIKDAEFKVNKDGNLLYASFESTEKEDYVFEINEKEYTIHSEKGGRVEFDLEKRELYTSVAKKFRGENFWLEGRHDLRELVTEAPGEVKEIKLYFDKEGNPIELTYTNGNLKIRDYEKEITDDYYSIYGPITVVFPNNEERFNELLEEGEIENIVYFNEEKTLFKGRVASDWLKTGYKYIGRDVNSYTEFHRETNHFSVKEGDVLFGNAQYEVEITGNKASFKRISHRISYSPFSFDYININEGLDRGYITGSELRLSFFTDEDNNPISIDLNKLATRRPMGVGEIIGEAVFGMYGLEVSRIYHEKLLELERQGKEEELEWYKTTLLKMKHDFQHGLAEIELDSAITDIKSHISSLERQLDTSIEPERITEIKKELRNYNEYLGELTTQNLASNMFGENVVRGSYDSFVGVPDAPSLPLSFEYLIGSDGRVRLERQDGGDWKVPRERYSLDELGSLYRGYEREYHLSNVKLDIPERLSGLLEESHKAREYYRRANELNPYPAGELELKEIKAVRSSGDSIEAQRLAQRIIDLDNRGEIRVSPEVLSKAYSEKALSLLQQASMYDRKKGNELLVESSNTIKKALEIDPNNHEAQSIKDNFAAAQLMGIEGLVPKEFEHVAIDLRALTGDIGEAHSMFQNILDRISAPFTIGQIGYKTFRIGDYTTLAEEQVDEAIKLGESARQLNRLLISGVDVEEYAKKGFWEKFYDVYRANHFDDLISIETLKKHIGSPELRGYTNERDRVNALIEVLSEKEGLNLNSFEFQNRFLSTLKYMGDINYGIENSETIKSLVEGTEFIPLPERLGDKIEIDGLTYTGLLAVDIVTNPLNWIGAGFAARGIGYTATTAGMKNIAITSTTREALSAWKTVTLRQLAKHYLIGITADAGTTAGMIGLAEIHPNLPLIAGGVMGAIAIRSFAKSTIDDIVRKTLKIYTDPLTGNKFVTPHELSRLQRAYRGQLSGDGNSYTARIGNNDVTFFVDSKAATKYLSAEQLKNFLDSTLARQGQKRVADSIGTYEYRKPDTSDFSPFENPQRLKDQAEDLKRFLERIPVSPDGKTQAVFLGGDGQHLKPAYDALSKKIGTTAKTSNFEINRNLLANSDEYQMIYNMALNNLRRKNPNFDILPDSKRFSQINNEIGWLLNSNNPGNLINEVSLYYGMNTIIRDAASFHRTGRGNFYDNLNNFFDYAIMSNPSTKQRSLELIADLKQSGVNFREPVVIADYAGKVHAQAHTLKLTVDWLSAKRNWDSLTTAQQRMLGGDYSLFSSPEIKIHVGVADTPWAPGISDLNLPTVYLQRGLGLDDIEKYRTEKLFIGTGQERIYLPSGSEEKEKAEALTKLIIEVMTKLFIILSQEF